MMSGNKKRKYREEEVEEEMEEVMNSEKFDELETFSCAKLRFTRIRHKNPLNLQIIDDLILDQIRKSHSLSDIHGVHSTPIKNREPTSNLSEV